MLSLVQLIAYVTYDLLEPCFSFPATAILPRQRMHLPLKNVFVMYIMAMSTERTSLYRDTLWGTLKMMQRLGYLYACQVMTFWPTKAERLALSFCQRRKIICVPIKLLKKAQCDGTQSRLVSLQIKDPQILFCWERSLLVLYTGGLKNRITVSFDLIQVAYCHQNIRQWYIWPTNIFILYNET